MNIASLIDSKLGPKKATKAQAGKPHVVTLARDLMERQRFLSTTDGYLYVYTGTHWEWIKEGYIKALALRADGEFDTTQTRRNEIAFLGSSFESISDAMFIGKFRESGDDPGSDVCIFVYPIS